MKRTALLYVIALVVTACGGGTTDTTVPATTTTAAPTTTGAVGTTTTADTGAGGATVVDVFVEDFAFSPSTVTIKVGDAVRWNLVGGSHTTTSGVAPTQDGMWNQTLATDPPVTIAFTEAGTFSYFCRFHGEAMTGRIVVEP